MEIEIEEKPYTLEIPNEITRLVPAFLKKKPLENLPWMYGSTKKSVLEECTLLAKLGAP